MSKRKIIIYFITFLLVLFTLIQGRSYFIAQKIKDSKEQIVVKFTSKERKPKITNFYFTYFVDNEKIVSANSGINYSILNSKLENEIIDNLILNKFYMAYISKEYPNSIKVDPKKQVTDTVAILEAGFSIEDIK